MSKHHTFMFYLASSGLGLYALSAMEGTNPQDSQVQNSQKVPASQQSVLPFKDFMAQKNRNQTPPKFATKLDKARWKAAQKKKKEAQHNPPTLSQSTVTSTSKMPQISGQAKEPRKFATKLEEARWKAQTRKAQKKNDPVSQPSVSLYKKKLHDLGRDTTKKMPSTLSSSVFQPYKPLFLYPLQKELHTAETMGLKALKEMLSKALKSFEASKKSLEPSQNTEEKSSKEKLQEIKHQSIKAELNRIETLLKAQENQAPKEIKEKDMEKKSVFQEFLQIEKSVDLKEHLKSIAKEFEDHMKAAETSQSIEAHLKHIYAFTRAYDTTPYLIQCAQWVEGYQKYKASQNLIKPQNTMVTSQTTTKPETLRETFPSQEEIIQETSQKGQNVPPSQTVIDKKQNQGKKKFQRSNQITITADNNSYNKDIQGFSFDLSNEIKKAKEQNIQNDEKENASSEDFSFESEEEEENKTNK